MDAFRSRKVNREANKRYQQQQKQEKKRKILSFDPSVDMIKIKHKKSLQSHININSHVEQKIFD